MELKLVDFFRTTSLGDRLAKDDTSEMKTRGPLGSREITFAMHSVSY